MGDAYQLLYTWKLPLAPFSSALKHCWIYSFVFQYLSSALDQLANDTVEEEDTESETNTSNVKTATRQGNENSVTLSQLVIETQANSEEIDTFEENLIEDFSDDDGLYDMLLE